MRGALVLAGATSCRARDWFPKMLGSAAKPSTHAAQRLLLPRKAMAQEFSDADLSPQFRSNGTRDAAQPAIPSRWRRAASRDYRLEVDGLVEQAGDRCRSRELRALPSRTQITRHDCVEGWSAIAQVEGRQACRRCSRPCSRRPAARYVVFHCADPMEADGTSPYYESIDMDDAYHPQTILAYDLNDKPLPVANGAPIRLRVERQLGYKHAKYVMRIELVESFAKIAGGKGGYWEDQGYEWYAGI